MNNTNRYLEAFKENFNLVGLAGIAATAMAFTTPIPLLIGLVAEVAYLMFYADSRWYAVRMAKKFDGEIEARREEFKAKILPLLKPEMRSRFLRLEDVRRGIGENADDNKEWFREVLRKLDFLLEKWLQFAAKDVQFRRYLESVLRDECGVSPQNGIFTPSQVATMPRRGKGAPPSSAAVPSAATRDADEVWTQNAVAQIQAHYDGEMDGIRQLVAVETDDTTKPVLEKRLEVLTRRREFVGKIGRIQTNLSHQLNLLEDSFGLISDEIRARPPQQVLSDIEDVVSQTNTMTQLLEDIAPYEQMLSS